MNQEPVVRREQDEHAHAQSLLILGMHRSGTSCLAGGLEAAGLSLGEVNTQAPYNRRGNRENRAIMDLHDDLLQANGGSWDAPPARVEWQAAHRARRDAILAGYPRAARWGFKDPRTLFTLSGWLEVLPAPRYVGTFRHPAAVAASLGSRNGFAPDKSYSVWLAYNERLLALHRETPFDLICFDWAPQRYTERLQAIARNLDLTLPEQGVAFFTPELRSNHSAPEAALPAPVAAAYRALLERAQ